METFDIVIIGVVHINEVGDANLSKIGFDRVSEIGIVPLSHFLFGFAPVYFPLRNALRCLELEWRLFEAVIFNPRCGVDEFYLSSDKCKAFALRVNVMAARCSITFVSVLQSNVFINIENAKVNSVVFSIEVFC